MMIRPIGVGQTNRRTASLKSGKWGTQMNSHNVFLHGIDEAVAKKSRVFISHRLTDKLYAWATAQYFETIGLYYYFDENDQVLQDVVRAGKDGDAAIVAAIDHGLQHSTHLLAILSKRTMGSWWVPYEIGAARVMGQDIRHLLLPSITPLMVPEYLRIYPELWSAKDLFGWVSDLTPWRRRFVNEQYREYLSDIFGELDPDEDTVQHWYDMADRKQARALCDLETILNREKTSE
jgi:hypothetical protein